MLSDQLLTDAVDRCSGRLDQNSLPKAVQPKSEFVYVYRVAETSCYSRSLIDRFLAKLLGANSLILVFAH